MYYFCRQNLFEETNTLEIVTPTDRIWISGKKFSEPVSQRTLDLDPEYSTKLADFFDTSWPVMSDKLIQAFSEIGVKNFDSYPMILRRVGTGEKYYNFSAVNFIGEIDAIDRERSLFTPNALRKFKSIVISSEKVGDLKSFRLVDGPGLLVVTEAVADYLRKWDFKTLLLQPTQEYDGV